MIRKMLTVFFVTAGTLHINAISNETEHFYLTRFNTLGHLPQMSTNVFLCSCEMSPLSEEGVMVVTCDWTFSSIYNH